MDYLVIEHLLIQPANRFIMANRKFHMTRHVGNMWRVKTETMFLKQRPASVKTNDTKHVLDIHTPGHLLSLDDGTIKPAGPSSNTQPKVTNGQKQLARWHPALRRLPDDDDVKVKVRRGIIALRDGSCTLT